ncbi:MAG: D-isomer specific 2-hydroxyacid dehydrogenase family protein [Actinomycetota bacterium]
MTASPLVAILPNPHTLRDAVEAGGGVVVPVSQAEALVWTDPYVPGPLAETLAGAPQIRWVQLPMAGIEKFAYLMHDGRTWTCGKGVFAEPVAEHAVALLLAGLRGIGPYAGATTWTEPTPVRLNRPLGYDSLLGARIAVLGGGGITEALLRLLEPFSVEATVVRRRPQPMAGAAQVVGPEILHEALADADAVVLALALTEETRGIIGGPELKAMTPDAWVVNVARGPHVVTEELVDALRQGVIGGAALDVTDPEPLPDGHPLWFMPNCLITPHVGAGNLAAAVRLLAARVTENVRRFGAGETLLGLVEAQAGY